MSVYERRKAREAAEQWYGPWDAMLQSIVAARGAREECSDVVAIDRDPRIQRIQYHSDRSVLAQCVHGAFESCEYCRTGKWATIAAEQLRSGSAVMGAIGHCTHCGSYTPMTCGCDGNRTVIDMLLEEKHGAETLANHSQDSGPQPEAENRQESASS